MVGTCKLCLKEKNLIKRSHIFPNFMYMGMRDEKGRMYVISSEHPLEHKVAQSGVHQQYIFCSDCDNGILGRLERYASNNFYKKPILTHSKDFNHIQVAQKEIIIHCSNIKYKDFKLFLLSLLWRASISNESLFENFKLVAEQEELLRFAIYNNSIVPPELFPCILLTCISNEVETDFVAIDPFKKDVVKFYINDFVYSFYLNPNKKDSTIMRLSINMNNSMEIMGLSVERWNEIRHSILVATVSASKSNL